MDGDDFNKAAKAQLCASDYMDMLDDDSLTDDEAMELLETLFDIMKSFVLMGYGIEPVNKLIEEFQMCASEPTNLLEYDDHMAQIINHGEFE